MKTPQPTDPARAIWYHRRPNRYAHDETADSALLDSERDEARQIAASVGATLVGEFVWAGSANSASHAQAWTTLQHLCAASRATYCIVLDPHELSRNLVELYEHTQALELTGVHVLHREETPDWTASIRELVKYIAGVIGENESQERSKRMREVWRRRKASQAEEAA